MPYGPRLQVIKIECRNHLLRNYGTKLRAMTLNNKYPIWFRNHLKSNIKRFRVAITKAIEYRSNILGLTDYQISVGLSQDINISFRHIMGAHDRCDEYICVRPRPINEKNLMKDAEKLGIVSDISQIISCLIANVDSLLMNVDNNEQFNSVINKHLAGKQINYSQRNLYNARVKPAIISCNSGGQFFRLMHKINIKVNDLSPERSFNNGPDQHYGLAESLPEDNISKEVLKKNKRRLYKCIAVGQT